VGDNSFMPPAHSDGNGPESPEDSHGAVQPPLERGAEPDFAAAETADIAHGVPTDVGQTASAGAGLPVFAEAAGAAPSVPAKRRSRALIVTAIGASYLVLAAGTAAAVVAIASPAPVDVAAALASASAGTGVSGAGAVSASAHASASASPSASPSPSPSPSPKSTVIGSVKDGIHSGDLRYFLLPPPDGPSSVQGDPDGNKESQSDVVKEYGGSSDVKSALSQLGFKGGAQRTYQDSTMGANVSIELLQFDSSGDADNWMQGFQLNGSGWTSFSIPGESGATAREKNADNLDSLIGVYAEGDTFYQITVYGTQTLPHSDLANLMTAEHGRLAHG